MAINNLNPRRTIWYSTEEPSNKYDLWLCPSTVTETDEHGNIVKKCLYDLKIYECGEWKIINFCHCNGGDDPSHYVAVESLRIVPNSVSMKVGDGRLLSCIITPSNATNQGVTWSIQESAAGRVAISINQNGYVTALNTGTATVIATSNDNPNILDTAVVTVTLSSGGNTYNVTVSPSPANGGTVSGGGKFEEGLNCTINAVPKSGFSFLHWIINGITEQGRAQRTFLVTEDTTCIAVFTQNTTPTVRTVSATSNSYDSADCIGEITNDGGATVTEKGFCYGLNANPNIDLDSHVQSSRGIMSELFSATIKELEADTTYHVRAYARNRAGIAYGEDKTVKTLAGGVPTVQTFNLYPLSLNSASGGGVVLNSGGSNVTAKGICWSTSQNPTVSGSHTTDGMGIGAFNSTMTGLDSNTTYYVKAYATNSYGTAYGELKLVTTPELAGPTDPPIVYVGQKKEISISEFGELSDEEILEGIEYLGNTDTEYSYQNWNGDDIYITYFIVKDGYTIVNSKFTSDNHELGVNWNVRGIGIMVDGNQYVIFANRVKYNSNDKYDVVIELL